ncbi:MAG: hypothetical protein HY694_16310 [Deltaproteobacteria bacterium]|nr:hypothetical protein [Deltaproteobacteria bacterium]
MLPAPFTSEFLSRLECLRLRTRKVLEKQLDTTNKLPAAVLRRVFGGEL